MSGAPRGNERERDEPLIPHPHRLNPENTAYQAIMDAHDHAVTSGEAGYLDPGTGLFVMTAATHLRRGRCCKNGCRHCPYLGGPDQPI